MVDGDVYSSDTEIQYVPNSASVLTDSTTINVGTTAAEDGSLVASLDNWGTSTTSGAITWTEDDVTITTSVTSGDFKIYNGDEDHIGNGLGSDNISTGLDLDNIVTVDVDGENINKVVFTLDGLGEWFDEDNENATEITITAYSYDDEGNAVAIASQSSYRDSNTFSDEYTFEITEPVSYFELSSGAGTDSTSKNAGKGSYVIQSINLVKSAQDSVNLTVTNPDGTTEEITKNILLDDTNSSDPITRIESSKEDE